MSNQQTERLYTVDGIRGLSLFGILMANMLIFQYGIWGKDAIEHFALSPVDKATYSFLKVFVETSFMPIFAFLFGFGMLKMKESLQQKDLPFRRYLVRRFLFLLAAGWLHSVYFWEGDILFFYGMMGFFLLLFVNRTKKTLMIWASILFALFALLSYGGTDDSTLFDPTKMGQYVQDTIVIYGSGTHEDIMYHRNNVEPPLEIPDWAYFAILLVVPLMTAPMFLYGMYAAKAKWFTDVRSHATRYRNGALFFIAAGLLGKACGYFFPAVPISGVLATLGSNALSFGYIFAFALLYTHVQRFGFLKLFESIGKCSLSNYLLQTIICTTIFYGYGLGYFGKLGTLAGVVLAIVIFIAQGLLSYHYLRFFKNGPVEKILRAWTYLSLSGKAKDRSPQLEGEGKQIDTVHVPNTL